MGGYGSGRHWYSSSKNTVNDYRSIDIRQWHRKNFLIPGTHFTSKWICDDEVTGSISVLAKEDCVVLSYKNKSSDGWKDITYPIALVWTPCNLGGKRPWFLCPAHNCKQRVAILYGGSVFACRDCYQLVYASQREGVGNRATRKADKIRKALDWEPGILNGEGIKPKGMHWNTFERLRKKHNNAVNLSIEEAILRFGINPSDFL